MKRTTVLSTLLLVGIVFLYSSIGSGQDQNCGRLKTGDSFNRINEILDCIESKIRVLESKESSPLPIWPKHESNTVVLPSHPTGFAKEPNDGIYDATPIIFGSSIKGKLTDRDPVDWYVFKTPDDVSDEFLVIFRYIDGNSGHELYIFDSNEKIIKSDEWSLGSDSYSVRADKKATYYVKIYSKVAVSLTMS